MLHLVLIPGQCRVSVRRRAIVSSYLTARCAREIFEAVDGMEAGDRPMRMDGVTGPHRFQEVDCPPVFAPLKVSLRVAGLLRLR
jgi:hypothetical protein